MTMELVHGTSLTEALARDDHDHDTRSTGASQGAVFAETVDSGVAPASGSDDLPMRFVSPGSQPACELAAFRAAMAQTVDALEFLHSKHILHRDLKPSNVLVTEQGAVKLLDFGLATRLDPMGATNDGDFAGTLAYMSPEQCQGASASAQTDLYALGCVMFQLLTGGLPFTGQPANMVRARVAEEPPKADQRVHGIPQELVELCRALMDRDPSSRPSLGRIRRILRGTGDSRPTVRRARQTFVGREHELDTLGSALAQAGKGEPQLAAVTGPSGIGKSALADQLIGIARDAGFLCLRGRCYEREQVPFVGLDRAVDQLVLALKQWPSHTLDGARGAIDQLAALFPAFSLLGARPQVPDTDSRKRVQLAFRAFADLLDHCQRVQPLLFVLDDLQWTDQESVEVLRSALRRINGRIMFLVLSRPDNVQAEHPLLPVIEHAQRNGLHCDLQRLAASDVAQLVRSSTEITDADLTAELAARSQGNPFLAQLLVTYLAHKDWTEPITLESLPSIDDLLAWQLGGLSARARSVLEVAATAGGDLSIELLRDASSLGPSDFDLALGELISGRLVQAQPGRAQRTGQRIDVYHDRIRESVYDGLDPVVCRRLHHGLATLLERSANQDEVVDALLYNWKGAGVHERVRTLAWRAAESAASKLAFRRAAHLCQLALEGVDGTDAQWRRLGELAETAGMSHVAADAYARALDRIPDAMRRVELLGRRGENLLMAGDIDAGREAFREGLAVAGLPLDRPLPVRLLVLAGLQARLTLRRLRPPARRIGPPDRDSTCRLAFLDTMVRAVAPHWPLYAAEAGLRTELLAEELADHTVLQRAAAFQALVPVFLTRPTARRIRSARASLDTAEMIAREHGIPGGDALVTMGRGIAWMPTDLGRARDAVERALEMFEAQGLLDYHDALACHTVYWFILFFRGDWNELLEELGRKRTNQLDGCVPQFHMAYLHSRLYAAMGEYERSAHSAAKIDETMRRTRSITLLTSGAATTASYAHFAAGAFTEALDAAQRALDVGKKVGALHSLMVRCMALEPYLDAALGLARSGALSHRVRTGARRHARFLIRHGLFDYPAAGHRALGLLEHSAGNPSPARRNIEDALVASARHPNPFRRWQCLEAARDVGLMNTEREEETTRLAAQGGLVHPPGWVR